MPKWSKSKGIRYFYKDYPYRTKKEHPLYLDRKTHKSLMKDFFDLIHQHLIDVKTYYPPWGMGEFRIVKYKEKINKRTRDFARELRYFKETGTKKYFYYQNFETDGYRIYAKWFTANYPALPAKKFYLFRACPRLKGKMTKSLTSKANIEDYYKVQKDTRFKDIKTLI